MTIQQAINEVDNLKPNAFGIKDKITWLSRLEARIVEEIISTHEYNDGEEEVSFSGYGPGDEETELLAGQPHDEIYVRWLEAQIDYNNMELDAFNNSNAVFESVYSSFRNAYNRSHKPKGFRNYYY